MLKKTISKPIAAGKVKVISGIRLPDNAGLGLPGREVGSRTDAERSAPQTRQRTASMLRRVPHVGQSLVGFVLVSGLINDQPWHYTSLWTFVNQPRRGAGNGILSKQWFGDPMPRKTVNE
jgi:hypothetical protein